MNHIICNQIRCFPINEWLRKNIDKYLSKQTQRRKEREEKKRKEKRKKKKKKKKRKEEKEEECSYNGDIYVGNFKNSKREGKGVFY